ncbi:MAG: glycosyltransferase family 4 protein [Sphingomonadaceae bacterium]|nr:glycosyltransferase family 4 protein [Sphingomonadaceae bacterium]
MPRTILVSINSCWNVVNFRAALVSDWITRGDRVIVAAPADEYTQAMKALGCEHINITLSARGTSPAEDLRLYREYRKIFRSLRPDVYLGYTIKPNIYGSLAARVAGIPIINNITGVGIGFADGRLVTILIRALYRHALARSHTIFFQNNEDRDRFVEAGLAALSSSQILPGSGVDIERFCPARRSSCGSTFLMIGRVIRSKGVAEYVEAAREVRRVHPQARFQLLGPTNFGGSDGFQSDTLNNWKEMGDVEFLGPTDDVRPFINRADCVVLPSYSEGVPRSLIEAAAMGKPLIATDIAGCRRIVQADVNGTLVPPRNSKALATACREFLRLSHGQRQKMGAAGRELVTRQFDDKIVVAKYAEAISRAIRAG